MKQIEKLAKEALVAWVRSDDCGFTGDELVSKAHDGEFEAGFAAGFRRAREMVLALDPHHASGSYFEVPRASIESLGEEEA